jgi:hypothetical protein
MLDFDANSLIAGLIVGSIGFVVFVYGKRMTRVPHMAVGVALMAYPYFVANPLIIAAIAVALLAGLWGAVRLGW